MLIFFKDNKYYIYIHIPKNSGKTIREKYKRNKIIKSYWDIENNLDLAHIPYILKNKYINKNVNYNYFTYTRNPYDRIISAFFYRYPNKNVNELKYFIENTLIYYKFDFQFKANIIHFYPQYLFVCNEKLEIPKHIKITKLEQIKTYNLSDYLDTIHIEIINKVYYKDFTLFNYPILEKIN